MSDWCERRGELARLLIRDHDAPPVAVLAAARSLILGDHMRLDELMSLAAAAGSAGNTTEEQA